MRVPCFAAGLLLLLLEPLLRYTREYIYSKLIDYNVVERCEGQYFG
jgi:hypothetical protein